MGNFTFTVHFSTFYTPGEMAGEGGRGGGGHYFYEWRLKWLQRKKVYTGNEISCLSCLNMMHKDVEKRIPRMCVCVRMCFMLFSLYLGVCVCACVFESVCVCLCVCACVCVCVCVHACTCICRPLLFNMIDLLAPSLHQCGRSPDTLPNHSCHSKTKSKEDSH